MSKHEQAFARVALLKEANDSRPVEIQAELVAWRFWRWPVAVALGVV
jgi:hypothetical protein